MGLHKTAAESLQLHHEGLILVGLRSTYKFTLVTQKTRSHRIINRVGRDLGGLLVQPKEQWASELKELEFFSSCTCSRFEIILRDVPNFFLEGEHTELLSLRKATQSS